MSLSSCGGGEKLTSNYACSAIKHNEIIEQKQIALYSVDARKLEEANLSWLMFFLRVQLAAHTNTQFFSEAEAEKPVRHSLLAGGELTAGPVRHQPAWAAVGSFCARRHRPGYANYFLHFLQISSVFSLQS